MSADLAAKRFDLLQNLRLLGMTGADAIKAAIDTTEETIDEVLNRSEQEIRSAHERLRQTGTPVQE